jgi:putative ABC transport system permease protein
MTPHSDLLHLSRSIRRSPAGAVAAIVTLSLTLGAGASIFAIVDAVVLTPPPFANPAALVTAGEAPLDQPAAAPRAIGFRTLRAWRERAGSLAAIEAFDGTNVTLTGLGTAERVSANNVTVDFLSRLGVAPAFGRGFTRDDDGARVVVISDRFWRSRLAGDPSAIGRTIVLGGEPHTILGVLPKAFFFALNPSDVWRPFPVASTQAAASGYRMFIVGRLSPGVAPAHLARALDDVSRETTPPSRAVVTPIVDAIAGGSGRMLALLTGAAAVAMLIAFTNLAGLLVVRAIDRRRELAVRSALGAGAGEIVKQLVLEAGAIVAIGTAGGVLLALWTTPAAARLALAQFGGVASLDVDVSWRAIATIVAIASACAAACGSLPAFLSARWSLVDALRRGVTPPPRERLMRRVFVTGEVALAFVLLTSVALLGRSLFGVLAIGPGFDASGVFTMSVSVPSGVYGSDDRVVSFYTALERALAERLGSRAVSVVDELPLTGDRGRTLVRARSIDPGADVVTRAASGAYFEVMRIAVVAGRAFDARDTASAPARAILSESAAQRLFAGESPIGRRIFVAATNRQAEVVGVVADVKHRALDEPRVPTMYRPIAQAPSRSCHIVVRSARADADVLGTTRAEVARLDRDLPVYAVQSMADVVAASPGVPARRVLTIAFTALALLALVLGGVGLFGVVAHDVASRRGELAIRIALGADPSRILGATLAQGAAIVGAGLAVGAGLSIWAARALASVIVLTSRFDPIGMALAAVVLIAVGAGAILPTARRAARTDPVSALRSE